CRRHTTHNPGFFPGHSGRFSGCNQQHECASPDRHHHGLYHSGHPVRELHSSSHHSVGAAVSRHGRIDHALCRGTAAHAVCLCRHDHADRHRQKECDHDG